MYAERQLHMLVGCFFDIGHCITLNPPFLLPLGQSSLIKKKKICYNIEICLIALTQPSQKEPRSSNSFHCTYVKVSPKSELTYSNPIWT
jgi:hypothetical protein